MAIRKIFKNESGGDLTIFNRIIGDGNSYDVPPRFWLDAYDTERLLTQLASGDVVLNDGSSDLSPSDALKHILRWQEAKDTIFDNTTAQLPGSPDNVQDAIEKSKSFRVHPVHFQFIGQMNYDQYLYAGIDSAGGRRSGDFSNGYRYDNSAPVTSLYSGAVVSATASITGIAQTTGSPASSLELKFELWKVGFSGQGTKLGDIIFNIVSANYTIGNYWNSSVLTAFAENQAQDVDVEAGDLLGLKFIRQTGNDKVVAVTNTTIVLEIEGAA